MHCSFTAELLWVQVVQESISLDSINWSPVEELPTQLAMKRKCLSVHQLPLELNTSQMFFPQPFALLKQSISRIACWNSVPYNHCQTSLEFYSQSHWNLSTLIITKVKCDQQLLKSSQSANPIYFFLIPTLNKN